MSAGSSNMKRQADAGSTKQQHAAESNRASRCARRRFRKGPFRFRHPHKIEALEVGSWGVLNDDPQDPDVVRMSQAKRSFWDGNNDDDDNGDDDENDDDSDDDEEDEEEDDDDDDDDKDDDNDNDDD